MILQDSEIIALADVIDWAISEGYNIKKNKITYEVLVKIVKDFNLNELSDNYYKERYDID